MRAVGARWATPARGRAGLVNLVQLLVLVEVVAYSLSTLLRDGDGFVVGWDGWLQGVAYVSVAVLLVLRPALSPFDRRIWELVAAGLVLRCTAFVWFLAVVRPHGAIFFPTLSDVGWLLSYPLFLAGLVALVRSRFHGLSATLLLDGASGAATAAALAMAVLAPALDGVHDPQPTLEAASVNVPYPSLDVLLLVVTAGVLAAYAWKPPLAVWLFGTGIVAITVVDATYLYQSAHGTWQPATPLSALSLVGTALLAFAGWSPLGRPNARRHDYLPAVLMPGALVVTCLALLVWAGFRPVPLASALLAAAGAVMAIVRMVLSYQEARALAQVRQTSRLDELTGLANRRALLDAVGRVLPRQCSLLLVDVDGFRSINDTMGHEHGDALLGLVASRLRVALRPKDLLARMGADEFAVLLSDGDRPMEMGRQLQAACAPPFTVAGQQLDVSVSIGIALAPEHASGSLELLQRAELALSDAKQHTAGLQLYRESLAEELHLVAELTSAIEHEQMVLHYQPLVSLVDGSVVGVEALVRWEHPTRGLLMPAAFLEQVASAGLSGELTTVLLEQAIGQLASWRQAGVDTAVSVNLSANELLDQGFPDRVDELLTRHQVPGNAVVLELTEDMLLADPVHGHEVIAALLTRDIKVQIDDYGTGYSTLGYLRDLPQLGGFKLDRSFVTHLDTNQRSRAIVGSTIRLARSLGVELIAEGVETQEVRERLVDLGCELAQGYLFARPVPAADVSFEPVAVGAS